ncbi:MAG: radical SAM protein [Candidatus Margulisiibacteriota bacterium]
MFSIFKKKKKLEKKPRFCCWVLNYRCMFRCRMCRIWDTHYDERTETTMDEKKRFVRSLRGLVDPGFEFHLSGGEPLLTNGIFELIRFIHEQGYKTNLVTNGFLINEAVAEKIIDSGLGMLTFSLDGSTAITHDLLRGMAGSHQKIIQAIGHLAGFSGRKLRIAILTTIMEKNLDEILDLAEWVQQDKRLDMISFQAVTQPFGEEIDADWTRKEKSSFLWPQDPQKVSAVMQKLRGLKNKGYKIGNHPDHFLQFKDYFLSPNKFLKKIKCNLGDYEFHVDPYGKVFFCCLMDPIGNIRTGSLSAMWDAPQTNKTREEVYSCRKNCHIMINCFYEPESAVKGEK